MGTDVRPHGAVRGNSRPTDGGAIAALGGVARRGGGADHRGPAADGGASRSSTTGRAPTAPTTVSGAAGAEQRSRRRRRDLDQPCRCRSGTWSSRRTTYGAGGGLHASGAAVVTSRAGPGTGNIAVSGAGRSVLRERRRCAVDACSSPRSRRTPSDETGAVLLVVASGTVVATASVFNNNYAGPDGGGARARGVREPPLRRGPLRVERHAGTSISAGGVCDRRCIGVALRLQRRVCDLHPVPRECE